MATSLNLDELKKEFDLNAENIQVKKKKKKSQEDCFQPTVDEKLEPDPLFEIHFNPPTPRKNPPDFVSLLFIKFLF